LALASQAKALPWKGDLHPMAKIIPITEHFQHFLSDLKETFWGDLYGQTQPAWKQFFEADSVGAGPLCGAGSVPAAAERAAAVSQRLLRARFCDPLRDDPAADRAHAWPELSALRTGTFSAAGGRGVHQAYSVQEQVGIVVAQPRLMPSGRVGAGNTAACSGGGEAHPLTPENFPRPHLSPRAVR